MQIQNAIQTLRVPSTRVALTYHSLPLLITFFGESTGLGSTVSDWGACSYCCVESVLLSFVKKFFGVTVCLGFQCTHPLCGWMEGGTVNEPFEWKQAAPDSTFILCQRVFKGGLVLLTQRNVVVPLSPIPSSSNDSQGIWYDTLTNFISLFSFSSTGYFSFTEGRRETG